LGKITRQLPEEQTIRTPQSSKMVVGGQRSAVWRHPVLRVLWFQYIPLIGEGMDSNPIIAIFADKPPRLLLVCNVQYSIF